jgi:hypothetical protein
MSTETEEKSYKIIKPSEWDPTQHEFTNLNANKNSQGSSGKVTYGGEQFYLMMPKMTCTFGASLPKLKPGEAHGPNPKWNGQLAFQTDTPSGRAFLQKAEAFNEHMINKFTEAKFQTANNLGAIPGKLASREVIESKCASGMMVKYHVDKVTKQRSDQYPPHMAVKFPTSYKAPHTFTCEFYDKDGNELVTPSCTPGATNCIDKVISPGCSVSGLLVGSSWSTGAACGVTWAFAQVRVYPGNQTIPKGKCLIEDPDDESGSQDSNSKPASSAAKPKPKPKLPPPTDDEEIIDEVE